MKSNTHVTNDCVVWIQFYIKNIILNNLNQQGIYVRDVSHIFFFTIASNRRLPTISGSLSKTTFRTKGCLKPTLLSNKLYFDDCNSFPDIRVIIVWTYIQRDSHIFLLFFKKKTKVNYLFSVVPNSCLNSCIDEIKKRKEQGHKHHRQAHK